MGYTKKFFLRGLIGIPLGIAICATISLIINIMVRNDTPQPEYQSLSFYIKSYIVSAIIGLVNGGGSVIWNVEKWSWQRKSAMYFLLVFVVGIVCATYAGWIAFEIVDLLKYAGIYAGIYIVLTIVMYFIYQAKLRKINDKINSKKE